MTPSLRCPACHTDGSRVFHDAGRVPVNSVLLLRSRQEALELPRGELRLAFCEACGFVYNAAFDPRLTEYSDRYEETQGFSPTFQRWHRELAQRLIARHDLRRKRVVEIGCGKGEFLALLCELGNNEGIGFDPSYVPGRLPAEAAERIHFVRDFYTEKTTDHGGDFVCCKMTLEHIPDVLGFVRMVRRSLEGSRGTTVFFQVPGIERILEERAFWDVYYEHCSYFSAGCLGRLFAHAGFDVLDVRREYGGQYVAIEAAPAEPDSTVAPVEDDRSLVAAAVGRFEREVPERLSWWERQLDAWRSGGKRVVLWGSGSKGVAFLTALGGRPDIEEVVDINPHKHGFFMAGSGQRIVGPDRLTERPPDTVVVMNPLYRDEIQADLEKRGLFPEVIAT